MARILVVEDDPDLLLLARLILAQDGHEITGVESAEAAEPLIEEHDLMLLDIRLPGRSGLELLADHIGAGGTVPAVVMSAHAGAAIREQALAIGAHDMLHKPFARERLLMAVSEALAA